MRIVESSIISKAVKGLCLSANIDLRKDILKALMSLRAKESNKGAKKALDIIIENAHIANEKKLPICQDTGMVVIYIKIGQNVMVKGNIKDAIAKGVKEAYKQGFFRKSVVKSPLSRQNTNTNLPPIIYMDIVGGNKIDITVVVKGFGCENLSKIKMFRPTAGIKEIEDFIVDAVKEGGSRPCPPVYIGIGMGGTLDKAVSLSKEAILRHAGKKNPEADIAKLEERIFKKVNALKIGPAGLGGRATALAVSILTYPTHIAGLPVAVNISCHATRSAGRVI